MLIVFVLCVLSLGNGKFHGVTDLGKVLKLQGYEDEPVVLSSCSGLFNVDIQWYPNKTSRVLRMHESGADFAGIEHFKIIHPKTAKDVFSTKVPTFGLPHSVNVCKSSNNS